jgi:hypothetical protein
MYMNNNFIDEKTHCNTFKLITTLGYGENKAHYR